MTITEQLDAALDKADEVYKSSDMTLGFKVDELGAVISALAIAVKQLDAQR